MAKRGPKIIQMDWVEFDKLCTLQCTLKEIASWFDCSEDTIERRVKEHSGMKFADYYAQKKGKGKIALRRAMMQNALNGNSTMQIWLSKQYLGMTDKIEIEEEIDLVTNFEKDETSKFNE